MEEHFVQDSHTLWLEDAEYRREFGAEMAKLDVAAALADARGIARTTQAALAERAGVSQAYIAKLERGDANPTIGTIGRLLGCIWMKTSIKLVPMEPLTSFESVFIESQSEPNTNVFVHDDIVTSLPNTAPVQWALDLG